VSVSDTLKDFEINLCRDTAHHTIVPQRVKFYRKNQTWRRPQKLKFGKSQYEDICTKFGEKMRRGHTERGLII